MEKTQEQRAAISKKISNALKGKPKPPRTPEHCANISKANKGKSRPQCSHPNFWKGKTKPKLSQEARAEVTRKQRSTRAANPRPSVNKGKTLPEIVGGEDKAKEITARRLKTFHENETTRQRKPPWNKGVTGWKQKNPNPRRRTRGLSYEQRYGSERGPEIRKKVGNIRRISYPWTEDMKLAARNATIERIISGKTNPQLNYKKAKAKIETIKGGGIVICQSSWEELLCKWLDNNSSVASFRKDKVRVSYVYENKRRAYIVDFLVTYSSGIQELIEVKPFDLLDKNENPTKFREARKWCTEKEVWYFKDFPNCIPPNPLTWIEFRAPKKVFSLQVGITPWIGPEYWGWLISYEEEKREMLLRYIHEQKKKVEIANFNFFYRLTEDGKIIVDREQGGGIGLSAPQEILDEITSTPKREQKLIEDFTPMIHVALFVICKLNNAPVKTTITDFKIVDGNFRTVQ